MSRPVSPLSLRRPKLAEFTLKGLCDPGQPDLAPFDWTLKRLDAVGQSTVPGAGTAFYEQYCEGQPLGSGDLVEVTEDSARSAAAVHAMQVALGDPAEGNALYSLEEVHAMMATMPDAWERVELVALILQKGEIPAALRGRVAAEGPELVAIAERHGCFPAAQDEPGNASGGTAPNPSP